MKKALLIVESQPVSVAEIVDLFRIVDNYDMVFLCFQSAPIVQDMHDVTGIWEIVAKPYATKITICHTDKDYTSVKKISDEYNDCDIFTSSVTIFTHLSSIDVKVALLPKVIGYRTVFLRAAYRQSKALDWLRSNIKITKGSK